MTFPLQRLKTLATVNDDKLPEDTPLDLTFRYIDIGAVAQGRLVGGLDEMDFGSAPSRARRLVRQGDTLVSTVRTYLKAVYSIGADTNDIVASTGFAVVRPRKVDARYLSWVLQSDLFIDEVVARSVGVSYPAINPEALLDIGVPIPSPTEQRAIADYLDAETARIDALIEKKERQRAVLEEHRLATIESALTSGSEPWVTLIETGNPFAPRIPSGWRLMRLKYVVRGIVDTAHATAPEVPGGDYLVVRTANVKDGRLLHEGGVFTDEATWRQWTRRAQPRPGDVLLTREAPAGEACVVPTDRPLCIGQRMVLLQFDEGFATGEWLVHSIYAGPARRFIALLSRSTTVAHLNMSDIGDVPIVIPPAEVREGVLAALNKRLHSIGRLAACIDRQVALLSEHRRALISDVVTGGTSGRAAA